MLLSKNVMLVSVIARWRIYSLNMTPSIRVLDPNLRPIVDKVIEGVELSHDDGVALYHSRDIHTIGRLANFVREKLHGDRTYFNRNRHINYTNVCALSCKFCSFYRKRGEEGAYEMPVEQVIATAKKMIEADGEIDPAERENLELFKALLSGS